MSAPAKELISIALLLRKHVPLDLPTVERAAGNAFREAPMPPKIVPLKGLPGFGILLGPMGVAILSLHKPYFRDADKIAVQISSTPARFAVQQHTAWLSVDLIGNPPVNDQLTIYGILGLLIAEFLNDDVLAMVRIPKGPIIAYDFSYIPMFRTRRAADVFRKGKPDRTVKVRGDNPEMDAAAAEARRRWPEFVTAFSRRRPDQSFAVKKKFTVGPNNELMWLTVTDIQRPAVHGTLNNTPNHIKSLKFGDKVDLLENEIEDWIYTDGPQNHGGFQINLLKNRQ